MEEMHLMSAEVESPFGSSPVTCSGGADVEGNRAL